VQTLHDEESRRRLRGLSVVALILFCALGLLPLACGGGGGGQDDEQILQHALRDFGKPTVVLLDTAALARAARAGEPISLPFARLADEGGGIVAREVQLTLRNLRNPELTEFVLKDGAAGSGSSMPLPPPATYQGTVRDGGVAVFTINDAIVEGSMLVAVPEGWSFIEPLEPQLRLHGVKPGARRRLLRKYNHIVYNAGDALDSRPGPDDPGMSSVPAGPPAPPSPLVMSIVADGDAALFRAYPLDSVMPFWLKQETLLNAVDWLYNCVEPEADADNAYADCSNDFDGGHDNFQARVRIDRLEVWTRGGPDSTRRGELLTQSISMTHQASPLCCGEPHTAGRSSLVHFLSGRDLADGAGLAAGEGGLNYYGKLCSDPDHPVLCHHAVSQIVSGHDFRGTAFHQQLLVAHEIGHNNFAREAFAGDTACWLFGEQCGSSVMSSNPFSRRNLYLYTLIDSEPMGVLLAEQLASHP
jgi:hypothetical protein